jgi:polysaccharide export outer membrane protein
MLASCVPNRNYVYLQKNDVKKKDLPVDTTLRTYSIDKFGYKVQPQDVLFVRFESLSGEEIDFLSRRTAQGMGANPAFASLFGEMVDENGEIEYPVIGKVKVAGLSVFEIQEKLRDIADDYVESPKVSVRLLNFRATILGEVMNEGHVTISNNRVSLLEVIGLAGGMSEFADKSKVKLIRQVGGEIDVQYLNLLDENFINSPYYYAHQNDVLIVPPLKQRPFRRYFGPNMALVVSALSLALLTLNLLK